MMTGAGISAASGIPTFRGQDGFWKEQKRYVNESDPTEVLRYSFFNEHPMAVWEWHYDFYKLMQGKEVNGGHTAISKFQAHCLQDSEMQSILITQNIDDLHCREIRKSPVLSKKKDALYMPTDENRAAFTPHCYEIHGNVHYMHCSEEEKECSKTFLACPSLEEFDAAHQAAEEKTITLEDGTT